MTGETLSAGEREALQAGCGQLVLVDRLDAGRPLGPLLEALAHRGGGPRVFAGAVKVYATRYECGIGDPDEALRCARLITRLAAASPRLGRREVPS